MLKGKGEFHVRLDKHPGLFQPTSGPTRKVHFQGTEVRRREKKTNQPTRMLHSSNRGRFAFLVSTYDRTVVEIRRD